jgi:hypothetical protein
MTTALEPRPTTSCWLLHWSQDLRCAAGYCTGAKTYDELLATAMEPRPTMSCWLLHWSQDLRRAAGDCTGAKTCDVLRATTLSQDLQ